MLGAALQRAGHRVVAVSGVSEASRDPRRRRCCPAYPCAPSRRSSPRPSCCCSTVPDDDLPALVAGLTATGAWQAGQIVVHTSGSHGVGVLRPGAGAARPAPGAAPGDDLHRHRDGPRPAGRLLLRRSPRRSRCARSPRRSSSRWAPSRSGSARRTARSTTRRSRTAPTTWSRWSRRRMQVLGVGRGGRAAPGARAAAVRGARQRDARWVTLLSPGRWPAATPVPWPAHLRELDRPDPGRAADLRRARPGHGRARAGQRAALGLRRRAAAGHPRRTQGALVTAPSTDAAPVPPGRARRGPHPRRAAGGPPAPSTRRHVAVVMTMGALHEGHAELIRRARGGGRSRGRDDLPQPAAVRGRGGPVALPAHRRRRPRDLRRARASTSSSLPTPGRHLPRRRPGRADRRGAARRRARGPVPARALRRRADRRRQAAAPHPGRQRLLRPEGRPAAAAHPADGPRPRLPRRGRRRCPPCASRTGWP